MLPRMIVTYDIASNVKMIARLQKGQKVSQYWYFIFSPAKGSLFPSALFTLFALRDILQEEILLPPSGRRPEIPTPEFQLLFHGGYPRDYFQIT